MNIDTQEIKRKIETEINESEIDNWHGITAENISEHLIEPKLEEYIDLIDESLIKELWTVLVELPNSHEGYTIYYDPIENAYGLGLKTVNKEKMTLGIYGSFITCLNGM